MRKIPVPTITAIALALPLGIGGLAVTAPATSTDASAQSAADHFFATCGVSTIYRCKSGHRNFILINGLYFGYLSGRSYLPYASDGADHKAFDYLRNRLDTGTFSGNYGPYDRIDGKTEREWHEEAFNRFFPDGVRPPIPPYINAHQYLMDHHRQLQGFQDGNTPEERLESFQDRCERVNGLLTMRFQFGERDWGANQCRVETVAEDPVGDVDPDAEPTIESYLVSFNPAADPADPLARFEDHLPTPYLFQVTAIEAFDTTNPNPFSGDEGTVISQHRDSIIELQEEVTTHDEAIATMLELQNMRARDIRSNTSSIAALNRRVDAFGDDIRKNTAGIALAYAFPSAGLNYDESFRLSGGAGYFREEAAAAFGFTGRLSQNVTASGGVGLADGVSGARIEIGYGW